jgi:hypothetical protein
MLASEVLHMKTINFITALAATLTVTLTATSSLHAMESHYIVNQPETKNGTLEVSYIKSQENLTERGYTSARVGTQSIDTMKLQYSYPVSPEVMAGFGAQFLSRSYSSDTYGQTHRVLGLGDFNLSLKAGIPFEPTTLVLGMEAGLSPQGAQEPYTRDNLTQASGNNFSGTQRLSPFVGLESYIGQIAIGAKLVSSFYSQQAVDNSSSNNMAPEKENSVLRGEAFAEFPIFKKVDIGILLGGSSNESKSQIYGQYRYDKATALMISLGSENQKIPYEKDSTDLVLGLRRIL